MDDGRSTIDDRSEAMVDGRSSVIHHEVDLIHNLVAIPSVSGDEGAAVRYLVDQMAGLGFEAFVDGAGNAVGIIGSDGPETVLLGHIDTVPGEIAVRIDDGKLYGRGAVDAKGPLAALVCAAARVGRTDQMRGRIVVIGCVEEEVPSSRGAHFIVDQYQPNFCIVGEPSGWSRITLGYKGVVRLRCRAEVNAGHSAHDRRTAAEQIVACWQRIEQGASEINSDRQKAFDQVLPTLIGFNSGGDGLREWATAEISIRLPLDVAPDQIVAQIRQSDPLVAIEVLGAAPAFRSERNTALVRAFNQAIRSHNGQPGHVLKTGTADLNVVGPAWRCPIVAYGPGDAALDHTPHEHIVIDEYLRSISVLQHTLACFHQTNVFSAPKGN